MYGWVSSSTGTLKYVDVYISSSGSSSGSGSGSSSGSGSGCIALQSISQF